MAKQKDINQATSALTQPTNTIPEKIAATNIHVNAMKASAEWAAALPVQQPAADWLAVADSIDTNQTKIDGLEKQLEAARGDQLVLLRRWAVKTRGCLNAVDGYCDGSKDKVKNLGFAVAARQPR